MITWFIYDITDNKIRNNIVKTAKEYGLYRVQKSVFLGNVNKNKLDEIILESKKIINEKEDSVYIFPMCEKDFKKSVLLGISFDKDFVLGELPALFL
ncbi:MAG: CRISPR-associated endonuclease Cas2 [Pseudoleptotrichia goodfellowii]|nr:CRISPR-associated endonuclease Cas2 [Pseudoleptotrichia goodfellowii]